METACVVVRLVRHNPPLKRLSLKSKQVVNSFDIASQMIGKRNRDDETPLTESKPTILQETKARFDSLLKATRQEDVLQKSDQKKFKKPSYASNRLKDMKVMKKRSMRKLSSSSQKLVSEDDQFSGDQEVKEPSEEIPSTEEVSKAILISSSDESLNSHQQGQATTIYNKSLTSLIQSDMYPTDAPVGNNSPVRPVPLPRGRQSTRDDSRETTSSHVSSPNSVLTAIEAGSPVGSNESSSSDHISHRTLNAHEEIQSGKKTEDYELKPLKAFSASYEEIDETNVDESRFENSYVNQTTAQQDASEMQNAASYEEILNDDQNTSDQLGRHQGTVHDSSSKHIRPAKKHRHKLKLSSQRAKGRGEVTDTDSSSNNDINVVVKKGTDITRQAMASVGQDGTSDSKISYTYENILGVSLHRCDALKIDSLIHHPLVRIHILDSTSGEYLKKSQQSRNVSYFKEPASIEHIQPLSSHPCNFKDPRSLIPIWGETLLFNEDITHFLHDSTIFFFEVVDFVSFDTAVMQYQKLGSESGWHRIAWAFLKPCGPNNTSNIDRRLRLQLYKPSTEKSFSNRSIYDKCHVYSWWSKGGWIQYPSTLHITVHRLPNPSNVSPSLRSNSALQPEQCLIDTDHTNDDDKVMLQNSARTISSASTLANDEEWSRLPMQSCKIPNNQESNLSTGVNGSFSVKFSHGGHHLAIIAVTQNMHNIRIYKVPGFVEVMCFQGHPGLVYSLDWSPDDELLLSASADCTACIWSVKTQKQLQMLPHPSFVYCAIFVPQNSRSLATGCCDSVIRIWRQSNKITDLELHQELVGHEGYVSTLCVNANGHLFSGDSVGQIRIWELEENSWTLLRILSIRELQGTILNQLLPHPGGRRLLVIARDSLLRMIDIGTGVAIQWFKGALNYRIYSIASISPCGGLVFAPSEDGTFHVWNADTGQLIASYSSLFHSIHKSSLSERQSLKIQTSTAIFGGAVDYHPFKHIAAFTVFGTHAPVVICSYNKNSSGKDIGLHFMHGTKQHKEFDSSSIGGYSANNFLTESKAGLFSTKPEMQFDGSQMEQMRDFMNGSTMVHSSCHKGVDSDKHKEGTHKLSHIIRQLDYVLQLSRMSKQQENQLLNIKEGRTTSVCPMVSPKQGSSPAKFSEKKENSCSIGSKENENKVTCSDDELHEEQKMDLTHYSQSDKENASSPKIFVSQPVQLHFVEEKKSFCTQSAKTKFKTRQAGRGKSQEANLSTTDTTTDSTNEY